jgi:hypothetical protein
MKTINLNGNERLHWIVKNLHNLVHKFIHLAFDTRFSLACILWDLQGFFCMWIVTFFPYEKLLYAVAELDENIGGERDGTKNKLWELRIYKSYKV